MKKQGVKHLLRDFLGGGSCRLARGDKPGSMNHPLTPLNLVLGYQSHDALFEFHLIHWLTELVEHQSTLEVVHKLVSVLLDLLFVACRDFLLQECSYALLTLEDHSLHLLLF